MRNLGNISELYKQVQKNSFKRAILNLSEKLGGGKIYLKREDLLHGGAHKINNTLGQALLAKKMNKKRIIAETGAGQHGVATAMACAALGIDPDNVAKVGELRADLAAAMASVSTDDDSLTIEVRELVLHKRRKSARKS